MHALADSRLNRRELVRVRLDHEDAFEAQADVLLDTLGATPDVDNALRWQVKLLQCLGKIHGVPFG